MTVSWSEIARENLAAAGELNKNGRHRASVNRAYFAAFAGITHELEQARVQFPADRECPPHGKLPRLIENHLKSLKDWQRRDLKKMTRLLYELRCLADYSRRTEVGRREASEALNQSIRACSHTGVLR